MEESHGTAPLGWEFQVCGLLGHHTVGIGGGPVDGQPPGSATPPVLLYGYRWITETVLSALKRRFDPAVHSWAWYREFHELVLAAAVYNLERALKQRSPRRHRIQQAAPFRLYGSFRQLSWLLRIYPRREYRLYRSMNYSIDLLRQGITNGFGTELLIVDPIRIWEFLTEDAIHLLFEADSLWELMAGLVLITYLEFPLFVIGFFATMALLIMIIIYRNIGRYISRIYPLIRDKPTSANTRITGFVTKHWYRYRGTNAFGWERDQIDSNQSDNN